MKKSRSRVYPDRNHYFVSDEDKHEISNLYLHGWHPRDIAKQIGISEKTAYKHCQIMFSPPRGWKKGYMSSAEERTIRTAVLQGNAIGSVCAKHRRPMWVVWPTVMPPAGLAAIAEEPKPPAPLMGITEITTHEYIERIGSDPPPTLMQRIKSLIGRMFRG
jgi:hypothetical protein